jgi:hypothetical protein
MLISAKKKHYIGLSNFFLFAFGFFFCETGWVFSHRNDAMLAKVKTRKPRLILATFGTRVGIGVKEKTYFYEGLHVVVSTPMRTKCLYYLRNFAKLHHEWCASHPNPGPG